MYEKTSFVRVRLKIYLNGSLRVLSLVLKEYYYFEHSIPNGISNNYQNDRLETINVVHQKMKRITRIAAVHDFC